ncbi:hypothetical protein GBAR_LOCUS16923, partial [Geodia barretti]
SVKAVRVDSINVSWSPPFTLEGVPILHSRSISPVRSLEQRNTTETHITLERHVPAPPTRSVHGMKWEREMLPERHS